MAHPKNVIRIPILETGKLRLREYKLPVPTSWYVGNLIPEPLATMEGRYKTQAEPAQDTRALGDRLLL